MRVSFLASGQTVAILFHHQFAGKSAKDVKRALVRWLGVTRYSQRLFAAGQPISDEQIFTEDLREVQVLLLPFERVCSRDHQLLLLAADRNDARQVEMLLDKPLDPGDFGGDPLYAAARRGNLRCAELLLEAKAFEFLDRDGKSALNSMPPRTRGGRCAADDSLRQRQRLGRGSAGDSFDDCCQCWQLASGVIASDRTSRGRYEGGAWRDGFKPGGSL